MKWVAPSFSLPRLLWLGLPIYWGYAIWQLILPAPLSLSMPQSMEEESLSQALAQSPWFASRPSVEASAPSPNANVRVQGIFKRNNGASIALIEVDGRTEILIEAQASTKGFTLIAANNFEIEIQEPNGRRSRARINTEQKPLSAMYQTTQRPATLMGQDSFIPNEQLQLRPINVPRPASLSPSPPTMPVVREQNSASPESKQDKSLPILDSLDSPLSPEMQGLLATIPRYQKLSRPQQEQIRGLLGSSAFAESVKTDPKILQELINSLPIEVPSQ